MESPIETALTESSRLQIVESIHSCAVDGEVVLLNPNNGLYYGLDAVGVRIWSLLGERLALGEIRNHLLQEFDVAPEILWQDLTRLVADMLSHGLLVITSQ